MLINIRGTNGSGKSTVVRELMQRVGYVAMHGVLGTRRPEAYQLTLNGASAPVFVVGPYDISTGGCDCLRPYAVMLEVVRKYAGRGHVIFEGALISDNWGACGAMLEESGQDAVVVFLTTPLAECLDRVGVRRVGRGNLVALNPRNTANRYKAIQKVQDRITKEGIVRVVETSSEGGVDVVHELLKG